MDPLCLFHLLVSIEVYPRVYVLETVPIMGFPVGCALFGFLLTEST